MTLHFFCDRGWMRGGDGLPPLTLALPSTDGETREKLESNFEGCQKNEKKTQSKNPIIELFFNISEGNCFKTKKHFSILVVLRHFE